MAEQFPQKSESCRNEKYIKPHGDVFLGEGPGLDQAGALVPSQFSLSDSNPKRTSSGNDPEA